MEELFKLAEQEMIDLKHPYVGTEHFMLAFLKQNKNEYIDYLTFKDCIIRIIVLIH